MSGYEIKRTIERDIAEHEIFISFDNDDDATLFYEWIESAGMRRFEEWRERELKARKDEE